VLSSVKGWVDETAYQLLGGKRLLLRLPPRVGKSYLMRLVMDELGKTAVFVDGSTFTEESQAKERDQIEARLLRTVDEHGSAQLLFDSYDRAISRSQGARLQTWLTSRLVDGNYSQDFGALFTARCSTEVHRAGAGSPLMSRVTPINPPLIAPEEAVTSEGTSVRDWFGDSALFAEQAHASRAFDPVGVADRLEQDVTYLDDVRKASAAAISCGRLDPNHHSYVARSATYGLLTGAGCTKLFERLQPLLATGPIDNPVWPDEWTASVEKFSQLVAGASEVIWVDRYMYRDIEHLRRFLRQVAEKTNCTIRLLGNREVSGRSISAAEVFRISSIPGVEARYMTPTDYRDLHDRHLVTSPGGWVVPQVHVVLGRQASGSAVAVPASGFGVDYSSIWHRSILP